ncbi:hypothetical protein DEI99_013120 [Curtobacterium sp. MCLR17_036]|uniref:hypothetical protein n=1 Tax=Curtobacterium sp. MCLR17_036 TaxID=2175620 RepID=UPI000DAAACCD|nr:hypothetical protein [Curtobacterium sp. MCLR17_036]WIE64170.1 hypothetical protein DEI99_013120 [Curtobacterium sp. MCLR17_036]
MNRTTRPTRTATATFAVGLALAATTVLAGCTAGGSSPDASPAAHRKATSVEVTADPASVAAEHFAVLSRPFAASDALPDDDPGPEHMVPNSQRLVATVHGTKYWIAATDGGGVALISRNRGADSAENWSVSSGEEVAEASVVTSMLDDSGHQTALVSDGYTASGADAMHEVATNVWTADLSAD